MDSIRDLLRPAAEIPSDLSLIGAKLDNAKHAEATVQLLDEFAQEPLGIGRPLSEDVKRALIPGLRAQSHRVVLLAFLGEEAIGVLVGFRVFSTFQARPVVNIHDFYVRRAHRGLGIGRAMLQLVETRARKLGCARITLEVREDNDRALRLYDSEGFDGQRSKDGRPRTLFLEKTLGPARTSHPSGS